MPEAGHQIVLVRHGETEWSAAGLHTSRTDVPLTEEGRRQAGVVGACLRDWRFALVLTSPLQRAAETCRLAGLGDVAEIRPDLMEWDYGGYEGRTTHEIRTEWPGWTLWSDGVPGGEGAEHVAARADRIVAEARRAATSSGYSRRGGSASQHRKAGASLWKRPRSACSASSERLP